MQLPRASRPAHFCSRLAPSSPAGSCLRPCGAGTQGPAHSQSSPAPRPWGRYNPGAWASNNASAASGLAWVAQQAMAAPHEHVRQRQHPCPGRLKATSAAPLPCSLVNHTPVGEQQQVVKQVQHLHRKSGQYTRLSFLGGSAGVWQLNLPAAMPNAGGGSPAADHATRSHGTIFHSGLCKQLTSGGGCSSEIRNCTRGGGTEWGGGWRNQSVMSWQPHSPR